MDNSFRTIRTLLIDLCYFHIQFSSDIFKSILKVNMGCNLSKHDRDDADQEMSSIPPRTQQSTNKSSSKKSKHSKKSTNSNAYRLGSGSVGHSNMPTEQIAANPSATTAAAAAAFDRESKRNTHTSKLGKQLQSEQSKSISRIRKEEASRNLQSRNQANLVWD